MTTTDVHETDVAIDRETATDAEAIVGVETKPRRAFRKRHVMAVLVTLTLVVTAAIEWGSGSTTSTVVRSPGSVTSAIPGSACRHLVAAVADALGIDPHDDARIVRATAALGDRCAQLGG